MLALFSPRVQGLLAEPLIPFRNQPQCLVLGVPCFRDQEPISRVANFGRWRGGGGVSALKHGLCQVPVGGT